MKNPVGPAPVGGVRIHRDGSFKFNGEQYRVMQGSDRPERDGSRYIVRVLSDVPGDWEMAAECFGYLSEVRAYVDRAAREGWPRL